MEPRVAAGKLSWPDPFPQESSDETNPQTDLAGRSRPLLRLDHGEGRGPGLRERLLRPVPAVLHLWRVRAVLLPTCALQGRVRRSLVWLLSPERARAAFQGRPLAPSLCQRPAIDCSPTQKEDAPWPNRISSRSGL